MIEKITVTYYKCTDCGFITTTEIEVCPACQGESKSYTKEGKKTTKYFSVKIPDEFKERATVPIIQYHGDSKCQ